MRSCYSCPVYWYEEQEEPDTLHWYFVDKCAGRFPFRHRFGTHYQTDHWAVQTFIGEQAGPRPYSKGNGPLLAPRGGITWNGELEWFDTGYPGTPPQTLIVCRDEISGTEPVPPPSTWWDLPMDAEGTGGYPFGFPPNAVGQLDWWWLEEGIDPEDSASVPRLHWFFREGEGMHLTTYFAGLGQPDDSGGQMSYFLFVSETDTTATWHYTVLSPFGGPVAVRIVMTKCVP